MSFMIGNIKIDGNLILGPMAGITDLPFRLLCKEKGADLLVTEMVSAKGILYNNKNTNTLLESKGKERPLAVQLFGSVPDILSDAAQRIQYRDFDILDINMGCPVPKVVNNGEGAALMKNPKLVGEIVKTVSAGIKKPVTIKIRSGFNNKDCNAVEIAKVAQENGAAAITVHGRTREQYYGGKADWDIIRQVKEAVTIPVIGNGDVFTPYDAKNMIEKTGCDGVMIARGAKGNPWIFKQIKEYQVTGSYNNHISFSEIKEMIMRHAIMVLEHKGEYTGIREMRKHVTWYTAGYPGSAKLRRQTVEIENIKELEVILDNYQKKAKI